MSANPGDLSEAKVGGGTPPPGLFWHSRVTAMVSSELSVPFGLRTQLFVRCGLDPIPKPAPVGSVASAPAARWLRPHWGRTPGY